MLFVKPTWPCGSGVVVPGMKPPPPSAGEVEAKHVAVGAEHGIDPATRPLSYLQLKPTHGPVFHGWYWKCVVWLNFSSWSMRKTAGAGKNGTPPTCGGKKRAATLDITTSAVNP